MPDPAIIVKNISKAYRIGIINRQTLQDEIRYWWHKTRGHNPLEYMGKIGQPTSSIQHPVSSNENPNTFWALKDITFTVQPGEVLGIIGRNGAGKSTLLKILTRITEPTSGNAVINGRVASLIDVGTGFHPELTGRENIFLNGSILGMKKDEITKKFDEIVAFAEVGEFLDTPVKRYSSGMYVRLAFAVAAHLKVEILLVDEVLAVGDMKFQKKCLGKMRSVTDEGRTILFVSHNMAAIRNLCNRTFLLECGRLVSDTDTERAISQYLDRNLAEGAVVSSEALEGKMEGKINRDNPSIRLREVALIDQEGLPRNAFRSDEGIRISMTYECLNMVSNLWVIVQIVDEENRSILTTQNVDGPDGMRFYRREPGVYKSSCLIPPNTFGERRFYVSVQLIYPEVEHLVFNKVLGFDLTFRGYENVYDGYNDSLVRPRLSWETHPFIE